MATAQNAPYASPANVLKVVGRYRERGLPDPLTLKALESVGISYSATSRVQQALRFLGLIDADGHRTQQFEKLRTATTEEYPGILTEIVRGAYHEVLTIVDPTQDSITAITDAFRHFEPTAQRDRMVTLFLGLCRESGIGPEKRYRRTQQPNATKAQQARTPRATGGGRRSSAATSAPSTAVAQPRGSSGDEPGDGTPDYRLLNVLLGQLPREGRWTEERRTKWLQALTAAVDLVVEVTGET
ncbi:MAG: hypothetical protein HW416_3484 [Chloroflexi bacterium]|nr:hypothetical protein [Chloroflexota bacterium]